MPHRRTGRRTGDDGSAPAPTGRAAAEQALAAGTGGEPADPAPEPPAAAPDAATANQESAAGTPTPLRPPAEPARPPSDPPSQSDRAAGAQGRTTGSLIPAHRPPTPPARLKSIPTPKGVTDHVYRFEHCGCGSSGASCLPACRTRPRFPRAGAGSGYRGPGRPATPAPRPWRAVAVAAGVPGVTARTGPTPGTTRPPACWRS